MASHVSALRVEFLLEGDFNLKKKTEDLGGFTYPERVGRRAVFPKEDAVWNQDRDVSEQVGVFAYL